MRKYYREIVNTISNRIFENPDRIDQINDVINHAEDVHTLCARAADMLYGVEELHLCGVEELNEDHLVDWDNALDEYVDDIADHIFTGKKIDNLSLISMASRSGQNVR